MPNFWNDRFLQKLNSFFESTRRSLIHSLGFSGRRAPQESQQNDIETGMVAVSAISNPEPQIFKSLSTLIFSKENIPQIIYASLLTGLSTTLNFLAPYLLGETIRSLSHEESAEPATFSTSFMITALITAYALCQITPNLRDQALASVGSRTTEELLGRITQHLLLEKSLHYNNTTPLADQMYLVQKGFPVSRIVMPLLTQIVPTMLEIGVAVIILSHKYGAEIGIGVAGMLALYTGYSVATTQPIIGAREIMLKMGGEAWEKITNAISQYKTIHDFGKSAYVMQMVEGAIKKAADAEINSNNIPMRIGMGHIIISRLAVLIAALHVGKSVISQQYSVQQFVVLVGYLNQLATLLPSFGLAINQLFASYPDLKLVFAELAKPSEVIDLDSKQLVLTKEPPGIVFEDLTFRYPHKLGETKKEPIFKNLSFTVESGKTVALVSESGAGKSTIFNLLYRYYIPEKGHIYIDGKDIQNLSLASLRENISLVGQNPNLFNASLRDNIKFGAKNPDTVTDAKIMKLAEATGLSDFIKTFPLGLDTQVGESGKALSGGQQQKVAVLRGLMKESPIFLFDEITAALDGTSANNLLQGINTMTAGVTTAIFITHKLVEAQYADQIIVLQKGSVIAQGTHSQLILNCDLYQTLWQQQNQSKVNVQVNRNLRTSALNFINDYLKEFNTFDTFLNKKKDIRVLISLRDAINQDQGMSDAEIEHRVKQLSIDRDKLEEYFSPLFMVNAANSIPILR